MAEGEPKSKAREIADMEPTRRGTPCSWCGKPIGRAMLRGAPYASECSGRHMAQRAVRDAKPFIDAENARYRAVQRDRQRASLRVVVGGLGR